MLQRIITGAIIAVLMIVVVVFSGTWFFPAFMTLLTVLGTYEMLSCIGTGKNGFIAPTDYTTRAEVAVLVKRILDYVNK